MKWILVTALLIAIPSAVLWSQSKGSLFIIGGGDRPPGLMKVMIEQAHLDPNDHIVILTNSSASPDTSFFYISEDLRPHCKQVIAMFHFENKQISASGREKSLHTYSVTDKEILDSIRSSKLIFITGGVQSRFMDVVLNTPVYIAIHQAFERGAMIAGTSAGAAVMSREMITGDQIRNDTLYSGSVDRIVKGNIQIAEGLGLVTSAIIDQHFIVRSRYNRLLTVLHKYPDKTAIGIDEETAILIKGLKASVYGNSQVVVLTKPKGFILKKNGIIGMEQAKISLYTAGDTFRIH